MSIRLFFLYGSHMDDKSRNQDDSLDDDDDYDNEHVIKKNNHMTPHMAPSSLHMQTNQYRKIKYTSKTPLGNLNKFHIHESNGSIRIRST